MPGGSMGPAPATFGLPAPCCCIALVACTAAIDSVEDTFPRPGEVGSRAASQTREGQRCYAGAPYAMTGAAAICARRYGAKGRWKVEGGEVANQEK